jgi:hypothetical protein
MICAYNFGMRKAVQPGRRTMMWSAAWARLFLVFLLATCTAAQQGQSASELVVTTKELPAAGLWNPYSFTLETNEGADAHSWQLVGGSLPRRLRLNDFGMIEGVVDEPGTFEIAIQAAGRGGSRSQPKKFTLNVEPPLQTDWSRKSQVSGSRIDGSVKVSNSTGRDFDLTFVVLAVNDVGRATAIGYQHFSLKRNTRDLELPFGGALTPGTYAVNIDVVGEEPVSKLIFRSRLVARQTISPGL